MEWVPFEISLELLVGIGAVAIAWVGIAIGRQNRIDDRIRDLEHKVIYRLGAWDQQDKKLLTPPEQASSVTDSKETRRLRVRPYFPSIFVGLGIGAIVLAILLQDAKKVALEKQVQTIQTQIEDVMERRFFYINTGKFAVLAGNQRYTGDIRTVLKAEPVARAMILDQFLSCDDGDRAVHAWSETTRRGGKDPSAVHIIDAHINEQGGVRLTIKSADIDPPTSGFAFVDVLILCEM